MSATAGDERHSPQWIRTRFPGSAFVRALDGVSKHQAPSNRARANELQLDDFMTPVKRSLTLRAKPSSMGRRNSAYHRRLFRMVDCRAELCRNYIFMGV